MGVETKPVKRRESRERGSTLVEFALTLLPLLALLMLLVNMAWVIFAWASIQEGVREGVRFAITRQSDAAIKAVVKNYSFGFANDTSSNGPIQIYYFAPDGTAKNANDPNGNSPGNTVKIVVSGISVTPMPSIWSSRSPLSLAASSADIVEPNTRTTTRF